MERWYYVRVAIKPKRVKPKIFHVPPHIHKAVKDRADKSGMKLSALVVRLIVNGLSQEAIATK